MPLHGPLALVHSDGHDQEVDLFAVLLVGGFELGEQRLAERAPGGPELDDHRLLADIAAQVDRLAIQILDLDGRGRLGTDRQPDLLFLGASRMRDSCYAEHRQCGRTKSTPHAAILTLKNPADPADSSNPSNPVSHHLSGENEVVLRHCEHYHSSDLFDPY